MATDATGAPTPLGIPKFNTSADAPSGLGSNAQMDAIDTLLAARVVKPSGIVSGEVPVWNGTTWVRSSATNIGAASLGSGSPDATKFLRGDGSWQVPTGGVTWTYATTPPGSPATGDIWIAVDSTTLPTYQWMFRWNGGSSNTDKWECVGGLGALNIVAAAVNTVSTTYADLSGSVGPSFTVPRAGVYNIEIGNEADTSGSVIAFMSYAIGGTGASDSDAVSVKMTGSSSGSPWAFGGMTNVRQKALAASTALVAKYRVSGSSYTAQNRWMRVTPVRVS